MIIIAGNLSALWSFQNEHLIKEPENIFFQNINYLTFSKNHLYYCVVQYTSSNKICIFKANGELFKVLEIDDYFTDKYIDLIKDTTKSEKILTSEELHNIPGSPLVLYNNNFSKARFVDNNTLLITGTINYIIERNSKESKSNLHKRKIPILFNYNINNDSLKIYKLYSNNEELFPQTDYLEVYKNKLYLRLFPLNLFKKELNSLKFVLAEYDLELKEWEPVLELPEEYEKYNLNLDLNYRYKIAEIDNLLYFMAPYTNYMFNINKDTVRFENMANPIEYSLNIFDSDSVVSHKEYYKLDSLSSNVIDFFIYNSKVNLILTKPNEDNEKVYHFKYTMKGKFLESKTLTDIKVESIFYSKNRQKIIKVYISDEKWYYDEIDIN